jgi:C1A family cysteine protease
MAKSVRGKPEASEGEDFRDRICNLIPSVDTKRDWDIGVTRMEAAAKAAAIPDQVDLRESWWEINDQGNTGSCVGWASTDGVLRYHLVKANRLAPKTLLSIRFVWMASKETDIFNNRPETFIEEAGTQLKAAVDVQRKYGCVHDAVLPFHLATQMFVGSEDDFYYAASLNRITNYINLRRNLDHWKEWLANHGPILAGLNVDQAFFNATATGGKLDKKVGAIAGGHAVCIVGYRKDGRFIIRNSWGKDWGDGGFCFASPKYITDLFYPESYGITL